MTQGNKRKFTPPIPARNGGAKPPISILELDRFNEVDIQRWRKISEQLDELQDVLHYHLAPERRLRQDRLVSALAKVTAVPIARTDFCRIVDYQYSLKPLSCAGSLTGVGGRFNPGMDLNDEISAWPALYIAENEATAYREKFQLSKDHVINGLGSEELALAKPKSHTLVTLSVKLTRIFDLTVADNLNGFVAVIANMKMPQQAQKLKAKLKIPPRELAMIRSSKGLLDSTTVHNWKTLPVQYDLPAASHILAQYVRKAKFEAIQYRSSKGGGLCLAIFPDLLEDSSCIEITDQCPEGVNCKALCAQTADQLCGWADQVSRASPSL